MGAEKKVILEARHLWKSYGKGEAKVDALADVSLEIYEGELLTILGSSGSGKSTLLNSLGGMDKPDRGAIFIGETDLCKMNDNALTDYRKKKYRLCFPVVQPYSRTDCKRKRCPYRLPSGNGRTGI